MGGTVWALLGMRFAQSLCRVSRAECLRTSTEVSTSLVDTTSVTVVKKDGKKFINQYEVIKDLGKGSFGKVRDCTRTNRQRRAATHLPSPRNQPPAGECAHKVQKKCMPHRSVCCR